MAGSGWEYGAPDLAARSYFDQAWLSLFSILTETRQAFLLDLAKTEFKEYTKQPFQGAPGVDEPYSKWGDRLWAYHAQLQSLYVLEPEREDGKVSSLLTLLRKCELYVQDYRIFSWLPCREADVRDRIEQLLSCSYSPLLRKPTIVNPIKSCIADTGLPSIKTLVEYKYIDSTATAKRIMEEVLADVGGYRSADYDHVVFVIYQTARFNRIGEWRKLIKKAEVSDFAQVMLLEGNNPSAMHKRQSTAHRNRIADPSEPKKRKSVKKSGPLAGSRNKSKTKKAATKTARGQS